MLISKVQTQRSTTPFLNSGLKTVERAKLFSPLNLKIDLDLNKNVNDMLKVEMQPPRTRRELVVYESRPTTFVQEFPTFRSKMPNFEELSLENTDKNTKLASVKFFHNFFAENTLQLATLSTNTAMATNFHQWNCAWRTTFTTIQTNTVWTISWKCHSKHQVWSAFSSNHHHHLIQEPDKQMTKMYDFGFPEISFHFYTL